MQRMKQFQEISKKINAPMIKCVPGEHDAGLDNGALYREVFRRKLLLVRSSRCSLRRLSTMFRGPSQRSERNSSLGSRKIWHAFTKSAPIVVFTHRPLFDLRPDWEWFTSDGDDVMNVLSAV